MLKEMTLSDMLGELSAFTISSEELKLETKLGEGASAAVYSGFWKGNQVAVKQFYASSTKEEKKEILNEAKIMLIGLKSSYLISLKAICLNPYAIAMELMPGSLHDLLKSDCKLPWSIHYQIACDVSHGLRELHDNGIIHRDLKSLNILLKNYRAKLTDFGIAKEIKPGIIQTILKTNGILKGSWLWMAPELFKKGNTWTEEADMYSLGMVLLELVTRKTPNRDLSLRDGTYSVDHPKVPDNCPKEIKPLLLSFLNEPENRPKMEKIIEKLECLLVAEQKIDLESEVKKLKAEMEQIKQQHQAELKELKRASNDMKYETLPVQTPKSTPPLPPVSQVMPQTLMPAPKPKATPEQLALQDKLIMACKQGDEKTVKLLLQQGAKPDIANVKGEQPLGAAVWGMCPDVVNALLKQAGGVAPMTWQECEQHNKKYYNNEVFIIPKFDPQTYEEWYDLLKKMEINPFIRAYHLKQAYENWHDEYAASWENLNRYVGASIHKTSHVAGGRFPYQEQDAIKDTESCYVHYRSKIKQNIESAKQPTVALHF